MQGCNGGYAIWAYEYVVDYGITTEEKYPYVVKYFDVKK